MTAKPTIPDCKSFDEVRANIIGYDDLIDTPFGA
jgi:hypothetical protein